MVKSEGFLVVRKCGEKEANLVFTSPPTLPAPTSKTHVERVYSNILTLSRRTENRSQNKAAECCSIDFLLVDTFFH